MSKLWWIDAESFQTQFPADERHRVIQLMHTARYEAEKTVYSSALPGDVIYLVQQGCLELFQTTPAQTRRTLARLGQGDLFGSLGLVEYGYKEGLAITLEPTTMLVLRKSSFEQLMKYAPAAGARLVEFLQEQVEAQVKVLNKRSSRQIYRRLCRLLLHFLDHPAYIIDEKPVRMQSDVRELASLLGTRPDVVATCLEQLEAKGIIEKHHHDLRLKDRKRLEAEA